MSNINYFRSLDVSVKDCLVKAKSLLNCNSKELPYLLGQLEIESMGFTRMRENLYYSSVQRIVDTFPRVKALAGISHVRNPEALGELLYGKYEFRGYGGIQLTWEGNHNAFFDAYNRPHGDYKDGEGVAQVNDFWLTTAYYFTLMQTKLTDSDYNNVTSCALKYGRLINRGINSKPNAITLDSVGRVRATKQWIGVCNQNGIV